MTHLQIMSFIAVFLLINLKVSSYMSDSTALVRRKVNVMFIIQEQFCHAFESEDVVNLKVLFLETRK